MSGAVAVRAARSPWDVALWMLWGLSLIALALGGDRSDLAQGLVAVAVIGGCYLLTRRFTDPPAPLGAPRSVWPGAAIVAGVLLLTMFEMFYRDAGGMVGGWSSLHWGIASRLAPVVRVLDEESLNNTVSYVVLPGLLLALIGWRARDFGLGRSRRGTLMAALLWSAPPLLLYGVAAAVIGHGKPQALAHRFFIDIFRNGYAEEILWRGMVMTVTVRVFGVSAGNVAQALVSGLWHVPSDLRDVHGTAWLAFADAIGTQAIVAYFFGLLTLRTGNVLASGAAHTLYDGGAVFV